MARVLITAFGPYGDWLDNSSWLAMVALTRDLPAHADITTRLYPVDFAVVRQRLESDVAECHDYVLHLGQAPGSSSIHLEAIGLNIAGASNDDGEAQAIVPDGPLAYRTKLPLQRWSRRLRQKGIPARVSYHAGTYLCNATLYLTHHLAEQRNLATQATFIHVPLTPHQVDNEKHDQVGTELPSLSPDIAAEALREILAEISA